MDVMENTTIEARKKRLVAICVVAAGLGIAALLLYFAFGRKGERVADATGSGADVEEVYENRMADPVYVAALGDVYKNRTRAEGAAQRLKAERKRIVEEVRKELGEGASEDDAVREIDARAAAGGLPQWTDLNEKIAQREAEVVALRRTAAEMVRVRIQREGRDNRKIAEGTARSNGAVPGTYNEAIAKYEAGVKAGTLAPLPEWKDAAQGVDFAAYNKELERRMEERAAADEAARARVAGEAEQEGAQGGEGGGDAAGEAAQEGNAEGDAK